MTSFGMFLRAIVVVVAVTAATLNSISCVSAVAYSESVGDDPNGLRPARLLLNTTSVELLFVFVCNAECVRCKPTEIARINVFANASVSLDTAFPHYYLSVRSGGVDGRQLCAEQLADGSNSNQGPLEFGESGVYLLQVFANRDTANCSVHTLVAPDNIYTPLIVAVAALCSAAVLYVIAKRTYVFYRRLVRARTVSHAVNSDLGPSGTGSTDSMLGQESASSGVDGARGNRKLKSSRMKSIDVLRGLCLAIMIFANYGSGGYQILDHSVWNGLHLADLVFPCFIFIMGIAIPLSFKALANKAMVINGVRQVNTRSFMLRILRRTALLFFFGLVTSNQAVTLDKLRIMGVLQRFAISYLVCALIEYLYFWMNKFSYVGINTFDQDSSFHTSHWLTLKLAFKELFFYPIQWLIVALLATCWLLVTFLLPVDDCPTGYLGPGGLHNNASHYNCTGGAAGYIDRLLLGDGHVYGQPTCQAVYETRVPFDPEGLLGCLTSCVLTYLGVATGHVVIHYQAPINRIKRLLFYAVVFGASATALCAASRDDGWIPINKNLWSLSFVLAMAACSLAALILLYLLVDVYELYSGTPFLYLGRNSITIYICHLVFQNSFPMFLIDNSHAALLGLDLYGVSCWCFVAWLMDYKKVYINL